MWLVCQTFVAFIMQLSSYLRPAVDAEGDTLPHVCLNLHSIWRATFLIADLYHSCPLRQGTFAIAGRHEESPFSRRWGTLIVKVMPSLKENSYFPNRCGHEICRHLLLYLILLRASQPSKTSEDCDHKVMMGSSPVFPSK